MQSSFESQNKRKATISHSSENEHETNKKVRVVEVITTSPSSRMPYRRLYQHALESIFTHLTLSELSRVSTTCKDWSAAVHSMRPIRACVDIDPTYLDLRKILNSRMMRHMSKMSVNFDCSATELAVFCDIIQQSKTMTAVEFCSGSRSSNSSYSTDSDYVMVISKAIIKSTSITTVVLKEVGEDAYLIAVAIEHSTSMKSVCLSDNKIDDDAVSIIAYAIEQSTSMTDMDLSHNEIGNDGAVDIADAINHSKSITAVDLSHNSISDDGASAIAEAIAQSTSMTSLNLSYNKIGDVGAGYLADAIQRSTSMTAVYLSSTEISTAGSILLANAIKKRTSSMTVLDLSCNSIDTTGAFAIADAIKKNTSLVLLDLSCNSMGAAGVYAITNAIKQQQQQQQQRASVITVELFGNFTDLTVKQKRRSHKKKKNKKVLKDGVIEF